MSVGGSDQQELAQIFDEIVALRGRIVNIHRALGDQPGALRAFMAMSRYVREDSALPADLRELVVLTVASQLANSYEISQHTPIAQRLGISDAKLTALEAPRANLGVFSDRERAAILYATDLATSEPPPDSVMDDLERTLKPGQIVDLALTVGWYRLVDAVIRGLRVAPEE